MSGLLDSLSSAAASLNAQRMGLDVAGQNLANINTEGYSRRTLVLAERPATDSQSAGTGVEVVGVRAQRDSFVEARIQVERRGLAHDQAMADSLSTIESALGQPGSSLDSAVSSFFDSFTALSQDPTSTSNRDAVVSRGRIVAQNFNDIAERLNAARQSADASIRGAVDQVNQLSTEVARLNAQITKVDSSSTDSLIDQRTVDANKLADLIGATLTQNSDGTINLTAGQGAPLVIGTSAFAIGVGQSASTGLSTLTVDGVDHTPDFTGGQIGGWLQVRDTLLPGYSNRLDQFASDLASSVNALHTAGYDAAGVSGHNFFTPPAGVAGAAANLSVAANVAADSSLVAASATGTSGNNATAQALAALRDHPIGSSSATPADVWAQLVYQVGADSADAQNSTTTRQQIVNQLDQLRDSTSAVSSDEEAANLMKFQRAYEASARYFVTISQTLDALMAMVQ